MFGERETSDPKQGEKKETQKDKEKDAPFTFDDWAAI